MIFLVYAAPLKAHASYLYVMNFAFLASDEVALC
jgi:hypothetical protein